MLLERACLRLTGRAGLPARIGLSVAARGSIASSAAAKVLEQRPAKRMVWLLFLQLLMGRQQRGIAALCGAPRHPPGPRSCGCGIKRA
jgi:hypothetical protein